MRGLELVIAAGKGKPARDLAKVDGDKRADDQAEDSPGQMVLDAIEARDPKMLERALRLCASGHGDGDEESPDSEEY